MGFSLRLPFTFGRLQPAAGRTKYDYTRQRLSILGIRKGRRELGNFNNNDLCVAFTPLSYLHTTSLQNHLHAR